MRGSLGAAKVVRAMIKKGSRRRVPLALPVPGVVTGLAKCTGTASGTLLLGVTGPEIQPRIAGLDYTSGPTPTAMQDRLVG